MNPHSHFRAYLAALVMLAAVPAEAAKAFAEV